jgi:glutaminase
VSATPFVSTGALPAPEVVQELVEDAHRRHLPISEGVNSTVYPALERVDPELFGVCVVGVTGTTHAAGDADVEFPIMSVAKPFVFGLVCDALGPEESRRRLGVNATGLPFNSLEAVERAPDGRTNPMVNPGAIATTALVQGETPEARWRSILSTLSRFAGRELEVDEEVYASASATNHRNRELVELLAGAGAIEGDPAVALDLYTRQSCLAVTARDLATMGATLADGGVNPVTGGQVLSAVTCRHVLAVMTTAGLYETSGDWLYDVGLPAKSGIGGGTVTVSPGKGGLGTFSPRLDGAGNSVRGQLVARHLSRALGLDLFASEPVR